MAEQPPRPATAGKDSVLWRQRIATHLFGGRPHKSTRKGRWDPYKTFSKKKDLASFFSGHRYRRHNRGDRRRFAKFAIKKTLESHPNDSYATIGGIIKQESVSDQLNGREALEGLVNAINAEGQREAYTEISEDIATRASSRANDSVLTQNISAAAQSILAASPNSLGPPIIPCARYLLASECGHYGHGKSTVWKSPFIPNLDNQDGRGGLLDHQITAIVWILSRLFGDLPALKLRDPTTGRYRQDITTPSDETYDRLRGPRYFGGILADSMGLGKTLITVALVDLLISQGLNIVPAEDGSSKHRPILLLTPNATVAHQWVEAFNKAANEFAPYTIVVSGNGLEAAINNHNIVYLSFEGFIQWPADLRYMWDENDPKASRAILIMTITSWASRTCYHHMGGWISCFTESGRGFSLVIVDEAHKVKNHRTRNWRSVYLLERHFTLLITATPCLNTLSDLFGLARLLWKTPEKYLKRDPEIWEAIEQEFNHPEHLASLDRYPSSHNFQLVAGRPAILAKLFYRNRDSRTVNIDLIRKYLRYFETLAILKRSSSTHLYADWEKTKTVSLQGMFPKVENYTVEISPGEVYDQEYQSVHIHHLVEYLERLKTWGGVAGKRARVTSEGETDREEVGSKEEAVEEEKDTKAPVFGQVRLFQIASSSLDVYDLNTIMMSNEHSTLAGEVAKMRTNRVNLLRLAQFLVLPTETQPKTHIAWMELATRNSPILRYILHYINENILTEKDIVLKKLLIIEDNVMVAFYYELVLQFLGLECRCMHSQLSLDERQELVNSFNSSKNGSCQILIQLYTVGFAGTNLHENCSRVLVASQSHSLHVQSQAVHRVIRVGQNSDVTVHRIMLKNSFHSFRESRQIEKILPELSSRAQGNTKNTLVRLLNLFQYEIRDAWNSPEGQKLLEEKNLLVDEESMETNKFLEPTPKKTKCEIMGQSSPRGKSIKIEDEIKILPLNIAHSRSPGRGIKVEETKNIPKDIAQSSPPSRSIKVEEEEANILRDLPSSAQYIAGAAVTTPGLGKRKRETIVPKTGDGSGGWSNVGMLSDDKAFLGMRTREAYYREFIELPQHIKSLFSHEKNRLRRLLSYGSRINSRSSCDRSSDSESERSSDSESDRRSDSESDSSNNGVGVFLSTAPWAEADLKCPAVLERALELSLRVRLGAGDFAMLPFPMIDLSRAPEALRQTLHRQLAETDHTDQDLDQEVSASESGSGSGSGSIFGSAKEQRDMLGSTNVNKSLTEIDQALEAQARFGDIDYR